MTLNSGTITSNDQIQIGHNSSTAQGVLNASAVARSPRRAGSTSGSAGKPATATVNLDGGSLSVNRVINGAGGNANF